MSGISWDYEETDPGYYHIYIMSGPLEEKMDIITIDIPQTSENDKDIQSMVDALRRIESRVDMT